MTGIEKLCIETTDNPKKLPVSGIEMTAVRDAGL